jgi:(p)ppGpp synthase/HD superfamily hydrolase
MGELERAIIIAADAHNGQTDKGGAPYILHPLRVMGQMKTADEMVVAVLHDVAEDCPEWPVERLAGNFGPSIGPALDAITKRAGEPYDAYLSRVGANQIARSVKMADLADNSDLRRLNREPTVEDARRRAKYQEAAGYLFSLPSPQQQEMK